MSRLRHLVLPLLACAMASCGKPASISKASPPSHEKEKPSAEEGSIKLTSQQVASAGIEIVRPTRGDGGGVIELPATIEGDPQALQVVSAGIGGRVVQLTRNLGQTIARGAPLAVIESQEVAQLKGAVEAARARLALAETNLAREQRLFDQRVSAAQDLVAARTAAIEARIAYRQAQGQISAAGAGGGALNRIAVRAPLSGQVIARRATLGQTVAADAELYRVADLRTVSIALNLTPADVAHIHPGTSVTIQAAGRQSEARISFIAPALDAETKQVPAVAVLDNRGGLWRIGEPVTAAVQLSGGADRALRIPSTAVQTFEGKSVVFVRTDDGFKATPITLGRPDGASVVVTGGLTGEEQIAATNSFVLKSTLGAKADED